MGSDGQGQQHRRTLIRDLQGQLEESEGVCICECVCVSVISVSLCVISVCAVCQHSICDRDGIGKNV